jgi:RHS repeat-associated protein
VRGGSIISCADQLLGEVLGLTGVPFSLNYSSLRVPGRAASRTLRIPLTSASLPGNLIRVESEVHVAGRMFANLHPAAANQLREFTWDGKDAYGRTVSGSQRALVRIGYVFPLVYAQAGNAGQFGYNGNGIPIAAVAARLEATLWQEHQVTIGAWDARDAGLGGWTFDAHHFYDPLGRKLYLGDGSTRSADSLTGVAGTYAGTGFDQYGGFGGPLASGGIRHPYSLAPAPDGSLFIYTDGGSSSDPRILRATPAGTLELYAGGGNAGGCGGEGVPKLSACLGMGNGANIVRAPDGSIFFTNVHRVRRITPAGLMETVVNTSGSPGFSGDGGPAALAQVADANGVALGPDGSLYIADATNRRIRRVGPDGIISTFAGTGGECPFDNFNSNYPNCDSGLPATAARIFPPRDVGVQPNGTVWFSHAGLLAYVTSDGIFHGSGGARYNSGGNDDGVSVHTADWFNRFVGMSMAPNGDLFIGLSNPSQIRQVRSDGKIYTVAGLSTGAQGFNGDGLPARQTQLNAPRGATIGADGKLYIADVTNYRVRAVDAAQPPFGGTELFVVSSDGGERYRFTEDGRHLETRDTSTGAVVHTFAYDSANRLVSITDGDGNVTRVVRNGAGSPTTVVGPWGQRTSVGLDGNGFLQTLTNPNGEAVTVAYTGGSSGGLLTSLTDPRTHASTYAYESDGRLKSATNRGGMTQTLVGVDSNSSDRLVTRTTEMGRTSVHVANTVTATTDNGAKRTLDTDEDGTQTEALRLADNAWKTKDLAEGSESTSTLTGDPRFAMQAPYASNASVTSGGKTLTQTSSKTVTGLNPADLLSFTTLTNSGQTNGRTADTAVFTQSTRTTALTSSAGRTASMTVDTQGRPTASAVTNLAGATYAYDAQGRLITSTLDPGGPLQRVVTLTYNPNAPNGVGDPQAPSGAGLLATITDPIARVVSFTYDLAGRVTGTSLPGGRTVSYQYDANGNLTRLVTPNGVTTPHDFTYTDDDMVSTYTPPAFAGGQGDASVRTVYSYNVDRQLDLVSLPGGRSIDPGYDAQGRINQLALSGGISHAYSYDAQGRPSTVSRSSSPTLTHGYNQGRLTSVQWSGVDQVNGTVTYDHDNDFRLSEVKVNNANAVAYAYDNDSLLTSVGSLLITRDAQRGGLITGSKLDVGVDIDDAVTYNSLGELLTYGAGHNGSTTDRYTLTLTRDGLGRIATKTESVGGVAQPVETYTYDSAGRLVKVNKSGVDTEWTYDLNGNRTSTKVGGTTTRTATHDAQDRLTAEGPAGAQTTYTYLADGHLASRTPFGGSATNYVYDPLGNLTQVAPPGGLPAQIDYVVDGMGRRIERRKNGAVTHRWLYHDGLCPVAELDGANAVVSRFVCAGGNAPVYMTKGGNTYRLVSDHLGSIRVVLRSDGSEEQRIDYDPWGVVLSDTNPFFQPFGFAGGLYDPDTGLVRFGARDYDPAIGRWTAKDPIGFEGGDTNLYAYVENAPQVAVDTRGRQSTGTSDPFAAFWQWLQTMFGPGGVKHGLHTPLGTSEGAALASAGVDIANSGISGNLVRNELLSILADPSLDCPTQVEANRLLEALDRETRGQNLGQSLRWQQSRMSEYLELKFRARNQGWRPLIALPDRR